MRAILKFQKAVSTIIAIASLATLVSIPLFRLHLHREREAILRAEQDSRAGGPKSERLKRRWHHGDPLAISMTEALFDFVVLPIIFVGVALLFVAIVVGFAPLEPSP